MHARGAVHSDCGPFLRQCLTSVITVKMWHSRSSIELSIRQTTFALSVYESWRSCASCFVCWPCYAQSTAPLPCCDVHHVENSCTQPTAFLREGTGAPWVSCWDQRDPVSRMRHDQTANSCGLASSCVVLRGCLVDLWSDVINVCISTHLANFTIVTFR